VLSTKEFKLFVLGKLRGVGTKTLLRAASTPRLEEVELRDCGELDPRIAAALTEPGALDAAVTEAHRDLDAARACGAHVTSALGERYPSLLRATPDRPMFLYAMGSLETLASDHTAAVIGTREPTRHGEIVAARIARYFAAEGWSVISGLALGCDTVAHRAALEVRGRTLAVLAHGLHTVAPRQNNRLAREIVESGGCLVSEYSFGTEPRAPQFVKRDRIQAGLALGVVMVQSDLQGGSLHASRACLEYGRILAIPEPTAEDRAARAKKIEANLVLCGQDPAARSALLQRPLSDLSRVTVLRSRDDYPLLKERFAASRG
jgi:DNA processing protein